MASKCEENIYIRYKHNMCEGCTAYAYEIGIDGCKELNRLEKLLAENGYTKRDIYELKNMDGAKTVKEQIDNINTEISYWEP